MPPPEKRPSNRFDYSRVPCRVCGASTTGYHYGVLSCDACKHFFRNNIAKQSVKCFSGKDTCDIGVQSGHLKCPRCRMRKCHTVGMDMARTKPGRLSHLDEEKRRAQMEEFTKAGELLPCETRVRKRSRPQSTTSLTPEKPESVTPPEGPVKFQEINLTKTDDNRDLSPGKESGYCTVSPVRQVPDSSSRVDFNANQAPFDGQLTSYNNAMSPSSQQSSSPRQARSPLCYSTAKPEQPPPIGDFQIRQYESVYYEKCLVNMVDEFLEFAWGENAALALASGPMMGFIMTKLVCLQRYTQRIYYMQHVPRDEMQLQMNPKAFLMCAFSRAACCRRGHELPSQSILMRFSNDGSALMDIYRNINDWTLASNFDDALLSLSMLILLCLDKPAWLQHVSILYNLYRSRLSAAVPSFETVVLTLREQQNLTVTHVTAFFNRVESCKVNFGSWTPLYQVANQAPSFLNERQPTTETVPLPEALTTISTCVVHPQHLDPATSTPC